MLSMLPKSEALRYRVEYVIERNCDENVDSSLVVTDWTCCVIVVP